MNVMDNYFDITMVPDYCKKGFLISVYEQYLYNLKISPYKTEWVSPYEIVAPEIQEWTCIGDKYLEDSKDDKSRLSMDIYQNGTYYPLIVEATNGNPYRLRDGIHRKYAMQMLIENGLWQKDKRVLVLTETDHEHYSKGGELVYHLPMMVVDEFKDNYKYIYDELLNNGNIKYIDEKKHFAEYRTRSKGYLAIACISLLLRNAMFDYRKKTGDVIKPADVFNNYNAWKEWRGY